MNLRRLVAPCALALMQAACATPMQTGETVDLSGRLALRGNEPFIYAVVYDARGVFELEGVTREQALSLQNQQVTVHGTVTRAQVLGAQLPALHVDSLHTVTPASAPSAPASQ